MTNLTGFPSWLKVCLYSVAGLTYIAFIILGLAWWLLKLIGLNVKATDHHLCLFFILFYIFFSNKARVFIFSPWTKAPSPHSSKIVRVALKTWACFFFPFFFMERSVMTSSQLWGTRNHVLIQYCDAKYFFLMVLSHMQETRTVCTIALSTFCLDLRAEMTDWRMFCYPPLENP